MATNEQRLLAQQYPGCFLGDPYDSFNLTISSNGANVYPWSNYSLVSKSGVTPYMPGISSSFVVQLSRAIVLDASENWAVTCSYISCSTPYSAGGSVNAPTIYVTSSLVNPSISSSKALNLLYVYAPPDDSLSNIVHVESNYLTQTRSLAYHQIAQIDITITDQDGDLIMNEYPTSITLNFRKYNK